MTPRLETPHFDIPFRFVADGTAEVEQDTPDDVRNCVEVVVRYPIGFRDDKPDFGIPVFLFMEEPLPVAEIGTAVLRWEPRATEQVTQKLDPLDEMVDQITVKVQSLRTV